jgi:hypothetical protein
MIRQAWLSRPVGKDLVSEDVLVHRVRRGYKC